MRRQICGTIGKKPTERREDKKTETASTEKRDGGDGNIKESGQQRWMFAEA